MTSAVGTLSRIWINGTVSDVLFWAEVKVLTNYISAHWCETRRVAAFVTNSVTADLAFIAQWNQFFIFSH